MIANLDAAISTHIRLAAETCRAQEACYEKLGALLTRKNFTDMIRAHYGRIQSGRKRIMIHDRGFDWHQTDRCNQHSINIHCDSSDMKIITRYVKRLWPYVIVRELPSSVVVYEFVSRAKWRCATTESSAIEEDNIDTETQYIAYILYHCVDNAREGLSAFIQPLTPEPHFASAEFRRQRWGAVAKLVYLSDARYDMDMLFSRWSADYRASMWCNLHDRLIELCIALAPLKLAPYELLWILDYIRPMNFRCYREGVPYDPNHTLKLRLFESVAVSYQKIRG
jgi:hypothetical protein